MTTFLMTASLGVLIAILGIVNMTGNISSLHSYHRHRVTEENRKPFGRLVGLGTMIIGFACIAFGALFLAAEQAQRDWFVFLGTAILIFGIAVGLGLSFYAMIKYNHGIF